MEALLSQAWREKSLVLLMADAVPQTERRTPRRVGNMVVDTVAVEPVSASNPQTEYFPSIKKGDWRDEVSEVRRGFGGKWS